LEKIANPIFMINIVVKNVTIAKMVLATRLVYAEMGANLPNTEPTI
jgi:hypothetical protein